MLCMMVGMNGAMVTMVAQAKGADMPTLCGVYLSRAIIISTLNFVLMSLLIILGGPLISKLVYQEVIEN